MHARSTAPILLLALVSSVPAFALQRAFVSSTGNDANVGGGCTLAAPCRSFQAAHTAVDASGEIVALDTAGYGAVTISKSVTIMSNPGVIAGIAVSTGPGVFIATPGVAVTLRGLSVNNVGMGTIGIEMTAGASLAIENCVVSRFGFGARVTTDAKVKVVDSLMRGNNTGMEVSTGAIAEVVGSRFIGNAGGFGFSVTGGAGSTVTTASITDSVASDNFTGFAANNLTADSWIRLSCIRCTSSNNVQNGFMVGADTGTTASMAVSSSKATFNGQYGFYQSSLGGGAAQLATPGNNTLYLNALGETFGTMTPLPAN